ncbi:MAG: hypothetical protein AAFP81_09955 [Pseudomonadota bacterium]
MFSKSLLISSVLAGLVFGTTASAQIESDSMGDLSAWGQRYLSSEEPEFPISLWRNSSDEVLLSLLQSVQTADLGPAERRLLRRIVLSPATRPRGELAEALLAERARLMLELGEARAAAALAPQLKQDARGLDAETLAVDLDLASGQEASACAELNGEFKQGDYWLKLRAVCAVLRDNYSGAQLAIEFAERQGVDDEWLIEAIFAAAGDAPNPPGARFDSGLNIALSSKAAFDTTDVTLAEGRPDLAAAAARRPGVPDELRVRLAEIASELDLITAEDRRDILFARLSGEDYIAASEIEQALQDLTDPLVADEVRSERLATVLQEASREGLTRYRNTARLFLPDIQDLTQSPVTATYAMDFAKAAMMAGDRETALSWLETFSFEGMAQPDPFEAAMLEAVDVISGGDDSVASLEAIQERLIGAVDSGAREDQAALVLAAWTGLGLPLSPLGRDFIVQVSDRGDRIAQGQVIGMKAAILSNAIAETGLTVLVTTSGEVGRLAASDYAALLETLIALGAEDIARELAIEASGFWKVPSE